MLPIVASIILSCSKSNLDLPTPIYIPNYYPLTKGSYWIYEEYYIDDAGVEQLTGKMDSVYVYGDSTVNGIKYKFINQTDFIPILQERGFYKDSSGYIIKHTDTSNVLVLPPTFSTDTFNVSTTDFKYQYYIAGRDSVIEINKTKYKTVDFRAYITPLSPAESYSGYFHSFYTFRVGLVKKQYFIPSTGKYTGYRIVRYKVNP